jgi:hypothetical protein
MFNLGFTNLPMHMANAITVFPSLESSFKILEIGEAVGSIRQDRSMGIFGVLGENPKMAPLEVHLTTSRGGKRDFRYELASDPLLTPILVNLAVYNSIAVSERGQGIVTFSVKGTIAIKGEQPVIVDSRFSSDSDASSSAALSIAVPVNYLMNAGYKNLDLESITVEIAAQENDQAAELDSIRFSRNEVKAGENLDLEVSYRKANGEITQDTYPIPIPENVSPGVLSMLVADGSTIMAVDDSEEGEKLIPRDLTQLIRLLNNQRKNDCFYVRFYRQAPGALVKGEGLPGLPPSIMSILKSDRKSGALTPIRTSTLMEYELPRTELVVSGAKVLKLVVKP